VLNLARNLEIECENQEEAEKITTEIEGAIDRSKKMYYSYKF
jgi:hypothetical protein